MKTATLNIATAILAITGLAAISNTAMAGKIAWQHTGELATVVSVSGNSVTLVTTKQATPVETAVEPNTQLGGICVDCGQFLPFTPAKSGASCVMCSCGSPNATCVSWKELKKPTWQAMLQSLPVGIGLRAVFNTPNDPASGLKSLYINRRQVLLPVSGLNALTPQQLVALVRPVGAVSATLVDGGTRIEMNLKNDWTNKASKTLIGILKKAGATVSSPVVLASAK